MSKKPSLAAHISTRSTPQSEPIPGAIGARQVENSAGGYVFAVDKWKRLERFLILGSEGGSYYASERTLTRENAQVVYDCASEDFTRTLNTVVDISEQGRAPKTSPCILALAMLCSHEPPKSGEAFAMLPRVCRIGTHLFEFNEMVKQLRGRGRSYRRGVGDWYKSKSAKDVAFQATKYKQREGWSHRDLLRLVKPKTENPEMDGVLAYIVGKPWDKLPAGEARTYLEVVEEVRVTDNKQRLCQLIHDHNLPREVLPTEWLKDRDVWMAMLPKMPPTALVRNLAKLGSIELLKPMSSATQIVCSKLADSEWLRKGRLHPLAILMALSIYRNGRGMKGDLSWIPDSSVIDALDGAFYGCFANIVPTGKRHLLAIDCSGSMGSGYVSGSFLTPRDAAAAMAMVAVQTENLTHTCVFSSKGSGGYASTNLQRNSGHAWGSYGSMYTGGGNDGISPVSLTKRCRLDHAVKTINSLPFGGTDCALPMQYALSRKIEADVFVIYTDSETWAGGTAHPIQALREYREKMVPNAKLIVVGMVANNFTIADPNDAGSMDVVGFDTSAPQVMADFVRN